MLTIIECTVESKAAAQNDWPHRTPTPPLHNPSKASPVSNSAGRKRKSVLAFAYGILQPTLGPLRRPHVSMCLDQRSQSPGDDCRLKSGVSDELSSFDEGSNVFYSALRDITAHAVSFTTATRPLLAKQHIGIRYAQVTNRVDASLQCHG